MVQRFAGGGAVPVKSLDTPQTFGWCCNCCDEEDTGGPGSEEPGRCTEVRGCSAQTTDTWPPLSAASPPSSGRHSPSPGSHSPGKKRREGMLEQSCYIYYKSVCFLCEVKLDSIKVMVFTTCS